MFWVWPFWVFLPETWDVITAEGTEKARRTQRIIMCGSALSVPSQRPLRLKNWKRLHSNVFTDFQKINWVWPKLSKWETTKDTKNTKDLNYLISFYRWPSESAFDMSSVFCFAYTQINWAKQHKGILRDMYQKILEIRTYPCPSCSSCPSWSAICQILLMIGCPSEADLCWYGELGKLRKRMRGGKWWEHGLRKR